MKDQLRKIKANQEAILDSMRVQLPEYELPQDSMDEDDLEPAQALPLAPSNNVVGLSSSLAPPRVGKGSL